MDLNLKEARHAKWRELIEEQSNGGLPRKSFCKQRGLVLSQFTY